MPTPTPLKDKTPIGPTLQLQGVWLQAGVGIRRTKGDPLLQRSHGFPWELSSTPARAPFSLDVIFVVHTHSATGPICRTQPMVDFPNEAVAGVSRRRDEENRES